MVRLEQKSTQSSCGDEHRCSVTVLAKFGVAILIRQSRAWALVIRVHASAVVLVSNSNQLPVL